MGEGSYEHKMIFIQNHMTLPHSKGEVAKLARNQGVVDEKLHWKSAYTQLVNFADKNHINIYKRPVKNNLVPEISEKPKKVTPTKTTFAQALADEIAITKEKLELLTTLYKLYQ